MKGQGRNSCPRACKCSFRAGKTPCRRARHRRGQPSAWDAAKRRAHRCPLLLLPNEGHIAGCRRADPRIRRGRIRFAGRVPAAGALRGGAPISDERENPRMETRLRRASWREARCLRVALRGWPAISGRGLIAARPRKPGCLKTDAIPGAASSAIQRHVALVEVAEEMLRRDAFAGHALHKVLGVVAAPVRVDVRAQPAEQPREIAAFEVAL